RECCLDREIAASGYTKEMQEDGELLYPSGSEGDDSATELLEFVEGSEDKLNYFSKDEESSADLTSEVGDVSESKTSNNTVYSSEEEAETAGSSEDTQSLNMSELSSALENAEGQNMHWKLSKDAESSETDFSKSKRITENAAEVENQRGEGECSKDKENEDECPELVDSSALDEKFGHY
ncbi:PREDICTED: serine/threonine-protein kinase RIO2-like, partial [Acanthisitta chloris]|uniref:serine/threonine-protein kinase RIO2-like n=1 Tax=Acanthisitta chloris TaxID=57068 RepID=UPI0004F0FFB5